MFWDEAQCTFWSSPWWFMDYRRHHITSSTLLEITSSPHASLVSISFIRHNGHKKSQPSPNTFLSTLNYRSFSIVNIFYVHMINLLLKLSCISLFGFWLLYSPCHDMNFLFCHAPIHRMADSSARTRYENMKTRRVRIESKTCRRAYGE